MAHVLNILVAACLYLHTVQSQYGFPSYNREDRRFGNQFTQNNFQSPRRVPSRVTNILHLQTEGPTYNREFVYPFNRPYDYEQQYYNNQRPYQTYEGRRPEYQNGPYNYNNNYPDRPQWQNNEQNTGGGNPIIVVVEEATESPNIPEIKQENSNSFEDRIEVTTKAPDFVTPSSNGGGEAYGSQPGIPTLPPFVAPSGGLPPLAPAGTQFAPPSGGLPPLAPAGTQSPFEQSSSRLPPLAPAGTMPPFTSVPDTANRGGFNYATQGLFHDSCDTPDGTVGSCVSLTECDPYLTQLKMARSNPEIVLKLRKAHCGFEGDNPKVCCPRKGIPTNTPSPLVTEPPATPLEPETKSEKPKSEVEIESPPEVPDDDQYVDALPDPPVCGSSNASFSRVVGGVPAKLGDFPWMALLGYRNARLREKVSFLCGGSIITKKHILTASHCYHTQRNKLTLVRLGELDLSRTDEGATPIDINIKRVIEHEGYDANAYLNDIAVLLLEQLIPFTDLIKPICLPRSAALRSLTFEKYTPLIAGWGELQWHGEQANLLQVVQLPVTSNEYCKKAFAAYKAQIIDDRVLCAGYEKGNKDACRGDSGGPLMQPIWDKVNYTTFFYQIGVVSFGKKCAEPGFPGVYTRVTTFMPWIEKTVLGHTL